MSNTDSNYSRQNYDTPAGPSRRGSFGLGKTLCAYVAGALGAAVGLGGVQGCQSTPRAPYSLPGTATLDAARGSDSTTSTPSLWQQYQNQLTGNRPYLEAPAPAVGSYLCEFIGFPFWFAFVYTTEDAVEAGGAGYLLAPFYGLGVGITEVTSEVGNAFPFFGKATWHGFNYNGVLDKIDTDETLSDTEKNVLKLKYWAEIPAGIGGAVGGALAASSGGGGSGHRSDSGSPLDGGDHVGTSGLQGR